jgi:acetyl-CoA carboxylase biotin carboxyl carrier protein
VGTSVYSVKSPVMGIFYCTPEEGANPFVKEGDRVDGGDVVCVIESMKIFTKLRAEKPGTVKKILVENEAMVIKNQALIEIETDVE